MTTARIKNLLAPRSFRSLRIEPSWELALFAGLTLAALALRLWELDGRTMHYDESLHIHNAWRLAEGQGYSHSPWMHGPFQINLTALMFKLFSDSDFTARLGYALFGALLVGLPYFFRTYLGRTGAVVTSVLLALSPSLLYFSRFGRNEILMVFFAVALLIVMWRYLNEGKNRYLYIASALLALIFATKETSYILVTIFGAALFLMAITELVPWALGRSKLSDLTGPAAFLVLLVTLSLPQWSALSSIPLGPLGLELINDGVGEVGLPVWGAPFVSFPVLSIPLAFDILLTGAIVIVPLGFMLLTARGRQSVKWLAPLTVLATLTFMLVSFPTGAIARDWLISFGVLATALAVSVIIGVMWRWRVWLICAGIFYTIWTALCTSFYGTFVQNHGYCPGEVSGVLQTMCQRLGGVYTGSWQGLGYWWAQHDVARGNQPWYYHFLTGSVYEFLPLVFGVIAVVYYLRRGDQLGMMLVFWAFMTFLAYTVAGEKMPWLLVNIAVPFILLAGKFIGEIADRVRWSRVLKSPPAALLVLAPLLLVAIVYLLHRSLDMGNVSSWQSWGLVMSIIVLTAASVVLVRWARPRVGMTLAGLGVAALMLGFGTFISFKASYTYADSRIEMLAYAQGSADLVGTLNALNNGVFDGSKGRMLVEVDYEMWYPFNWYVRHEDKESTLEFRCYKDESEDGYVPWCNPLKEQATTKALLLIENHSSRDKEYLEGYEKTGPFRNLLWFPENYRRRHENRQSESIWVEFKKDFLAVKNNITRGESWQDALDYFLFRELGNSWYDSKYYAYISKGEPE